MYNLLLSIGLGAGVLLQDSTATAAAAAAETSGAAWWQWAIFGVLVIFGLVVLSRLAGLADDMTRDRNF